MSEIDAAQPRRSGRNQIIFWGLVALAVAAVLVLRHAIGPNLATHGRNHPAVSQPLLALDLVGLTGSATDVDLQGVSGNVVLLNFWGTWCRPCGYELPHIAALRRDLARHPDFRVLAVSCGQRRPEDIGELRSATQQFLADNKIELPTYADPSGATRKAVGMALGEEDLQGLPMTVMIDRQGMVRAVWEGYGPGLEEDMRKAVEEVLAKKGSQPTMGR